MYACGMTLAYLRGGLSTCSVVKRYPEPMVHGPEARKPLHQLRRRQCLPSAGNPLSLICGIPNPIPNH